MTAEHSIWVEKYRPTTLDGYIGNEHVKTKFAQYIANQDIPHLLLTGVAGTGKSTLAKIVVHNIDCDLMFLNASDENSIEVMRSKIKGFASSMGMAPLKIVVLDECDHISVPAQALLRNLMEQYSLTTRFILTANYKERIIDPLISRTQEYHITPPSIKEVCKHVGSILQQETVAYAPVDIKTMVEMYFPDIRKIINEIQLHVTDNKLQLDAQTVTNSDIPRRIIARLANPKKETALVDIRQLIANAHVRDYTDMYRALFDHIVEYAPESQIGNVILSIAEGQYRDSLVVDKEITMIATIVNILNVF